MEGLSAERCHLDPIDSTPKRMHEKAVPVAL
jgi:hypothetical protein